MKILDIILVLTIVLTLSHTEEDNREYGKNVTAYSYHTKIGIPKAAILSVYKQISDANLNIIYQIVGGEVTHIQDVPYQVGLIITLRILLKSICGGSLISSTRVLSAAHCYFDGIFKAKSFEVVLGSNKLFEGGERIHTKDVAVHPGWNPRTITNDLVVLRILPVTFSHLIQPIALPGGKMLTNKFAGWTALASGYGLTGDVIEECPFFCLDKQILITQDLSSVNLTIISNADCANTYDDLIKNTTICTGGDDRRTTCQGDSGGPLVVTFDGKPILVGATSFGAQDGCEKGYPVAYSRISSFVDWIVDQ